MNFLWILAWVVMLSATALAGPNVPAQVVAALREVLRLSTRRAGSFPFARMS